MGGDGEYYGILEIDEGFQFSIACNVGLSRSLAHASFPDVSISYMDRTELGMNRLPQHGSCFGMTRSLKHRDLNSLFLYRHGVFFPCRYLRAEPSEIMMS